MDDKVLICVIYSTWDGDGGDMYYQVDRQTGKKHRIPDKQAREWISEGKAELLIDYESIPKIRLVFSENPNNRAYKIDKNGKETSIPFADAHELLTNGRAMIQDIELEKKAEEKLPVRQETVKVYTSRFQNPELKSGKYTVVGIVRGLPKFQLGYERAGNIIDIAPPRELFNVYDREQFTPPYMAHLDRIGLERISAQIKRYCELGKDVVLCCYEDVREPNEWCHRLVFAEWWLKNTGERIEELPNPAPVKFTKRHKLMSL